MEWIVLRHDINSRKIEPFNIFRHGGFAKDVDKLLNERLTKEEFTERLRRITQYYFWARAEYEIAVSSCPVYIDESELARLNAESGKKYRSYDIRPTVGAKIDIYYQVRLNWEVFAEYVWRKGHLSE